MPTVAVTALLLAATACSDLTNSASAFTCSGSPTSSNTATKSASSEKAPTIALLMDTTALDKSYGSKELKADRQQAVEAVLDTGFERHAELYVGYISAPGEAKLAFRRSLKLEQEGHNPRDCRDDERKKRQKVLDAMRRTTTGPTDVLGGLSMLNLSLDRPSSSPSQAVADRPGVDVVIISSMLNNTEDLKPEAQQQDPSTVVPALRQNNLLRDCSGWRVYLVGPGRTGSRNLGGTQLANLQRFWQGAFRTCGGELWGFQPQLTAFPAAGPLRDHPEPCTQVVPAGVLFDTGKAEIRPDAEPWLNQIIDNVRRDAKEHHSQAVEVVGHTDSDGSDAMNQVLSEQRAQSVASRIGASLSGLTITPIGRGESDPAFPNDTPEHKANNRRVVVTVAC